MLNVLFPDLIISQPLTVQPFPYSPFACCVAAPMGVVCNWTS